MSENVILTCQDCGNKVPMKLLNKYERVDNVQMDYGGYTAQFHDIFEFFECPVCEGYQLFHTHWNTEEAYYEGDNIYDDGVVLYPKNEMVNVSQLPASVKNAYESALKIRNIENTLCAMAVRRTLEMVCKDQGATNGKLHQKLNQLQQMNILPPLMGDLSKIIKDSGNMAAHGDEVIFEKPMVDSLFRFTNKVLEYIYILPSEMERTRMEVSILSGEPLKKEGDNQS